MVDNKDKHDLLAGDLEERLKQQEAKLAKAEEDVLSAGSVKIDELEAGSGIAPEKRFQIGYKAVSRAERGKDSDDGLSKDIANKYQTLGKRMLHDDASDTLDAGVRGQVSRFLGHDPGDVRIHTGELAQKASEALGARAFALGGSDIYFGRGQYAPDTTEGMGTLVHELTHTSDNISGAAFSSDSSNSDRGQAETRAREAESKVIQEGDGLNAGDAAQSAAGEPSKEPIDMGKLEDKVAQILEKGQKRMRERSGVS